MKRKKSFIDKAKTDEVTFGRLFDAYYPKIFNYIVRRIGHVQTAQDLAADTFYKAFKKRTSFTWRGVSFGAWLYRIASNEINMHARQKPVISLEQLAETQGIDVPSSVNLAEELLEAERVLETVQDVAKLRAIIESLPEKYREVLYLRYFGEKKMSEIAEVLGKNEGTVKSLLSRATEKLRQGMQT